MLSLRGDWPGRIVLCGLIVSAAPGCREAPVEEKLGGRTMGTTWSARYWRPANGPPAGRVERLLNAELTKIVEQMSTYEDGSALSRFNASAPAGDWFPVSEEVVEVVSLAQEIAARTGGALDITVGPAVNLWGFGPGGRRRGLPTEGEVAAALSTIGYSRVEARSDPPALRRSMPGVYVDLSAVAKGYAADRVCLVLRELGAGGCLVEIGGEVATHGVKPGGEPWRIGVEKPDADGRDVQAVVELSGEAIATSGDYRNFFEVDGVRYSHTINPKTGRPVAHDLATVTVRAGNCMEADALATALLVMGPTTGYDWAVANNVAALMVRRTDDGAVENATPAW